MIFNSLMALVSSIACLYDERFYTIMQKKWPELATFFLKNMEFLKPLPGRGLHFDVESKERTITIIDSSYNASPASVASEIEILSFAKRRQIIVIGDMMELGAFAKAEHQKVFENISKTNIDKVYAVGNLVKDGFDALCQSQKGAWAQTTDEIFELLKNDLCDKDIVLIKGSHSMKLDQIVQWICEDYTSIH
jgi:UDP-N-acetylmuramoyl-tripeptide--D-alanyl-D-alanine ligase